MSDNQRAKRLLALLDDIRAESDQPVFDHTPCAALGNGFARDTRTGLFVPAPRRAAVDSDVVDYLLRK
jgi:hypothetical protein